MYAIIRSGAKQRRVQVGDKLRVERLDGDIGAVVELVDVLLLDDENGQVKIGQPVVQGAKVVATITDQARAKKVIIFKRRRRKGFHKKRGHRQYYTEIQVTSIAGV